MIYSSIGKNIIRVKFCSYQYEPLIATTTELKNLIEKCPDLKVGVISLPNKTKYYCVNRSPHVNTNSREQFGIKKFSQVMEIEFLSDQDIDKFLNIIDNFNLPPGVSSEISNESPPFGAFYTRKISPD